MVALRPGAFRRRLYLVRVWRNSSRGVKGWSLTLPISAISYPSLVFPVTSCSVPNSSESGILKVINKPVQIFITLVVYSYGLVDDIVYKQGNYYSILYPNYNIDMSDKK